MLIFKGALNNFFALNVSLALISSQWSLALRSLFVFKSVCCGCMTFLLVHNNNVCLSFCSLLIINAYSASHTIYINETDVFGFIKNEVSQNDNWRIILWAVHILYFLEIWVCWNTELCQITELRQNGSLSDLYFQICLTYPVLLRHY